MITRVGSHVSSVTTIFANFLPKFGTCEHDLDMGDSADPDSQIRNRRI